MFRKLTMLFVLSFAVQASYADDAKQAAIEKLSVTIHLKERIESLRLEALATAEKQSSQMDAQYSRDMPGVTDAKRVALLAASRTLFQSIAQSWDSTQAVKIYVTALMDLLPADIAEKSTEFFATVEGQRTLSALASAEQKMTSYMRNSQENAYAAAYLRFFFEVKSIMP